MRSVLLAGRVVALLAAVVMAVPERGALACSIFTPGPRREVVPPDGSIGFPIDGIIRVFVHEFSEPQRMAIAREYRLVDAKGTIVPLDASLLLTRLDLRPQAVLEPGARYTLEQLYAFDATGVLLSDEQRLRGLIERTPGLRRAWFPTVTFETDATPRPARAATVLRLTNATVHYAYGGGDCGPGMLVKADVQLPSAILPTDTLELEARAPGVPSKLVDVRPSVGATSVGAGDMIGPDPVVIASRDGIELRLRAVDPAGASVGASDWTRVRGAPDRPIPEGWDEARVAETTRQNARGSRHVSEWLSLPVVPSVAMRPRGPAACPHGLEVASRVDMGSFRRQSISGPGPVVVFDGDRGYIARSRGEERTRTDVTAFDAGGATTPIRTGLAGATEAAALGPAGPVIVTREYRSRGRRAVLLRALTPTGATRREIALPAAVHDYGIAIGGGLVLSLGEDRSSERGLLSWHLVRESDGSAIANHLMHGPAMDLGPVSATWVDGYFLLAWSERTPDGPPGLTTMTLSSQGVKGVPTTLPLAFRPRGLATAGSRVAVVGDDFRGEVMWALLSAAGGVERGPVAVSAGVGGGRNHSPHVAFTDGLFAVSWQAGPFGGTHAAVLDLNGALSPSARLDGRLDESMPSLVAAHAHSFLATHTLREDDDVILASLRCRQGAPHGPPQFIRVP